MQEIGSGTVQGVLDYLDTLIKKGRLPEGSVKPLDSAVRTVFSEVDGEGWQKIEVRTVNVDDHMRRFSNLTNGQYKPESLRAYRSRLSRALSWYKEFLANPGWIPTSKKGRGSKTPVQSSDTLPQTHTSDVPQTSVETPSEVETPLDTKSDLIAYPFALDAGKIARLYLPLGLSKGEVARLKIFLDSIPLKDV